MFVLLGRSSRSQPRSKGVYVDLIWRYGCVTRVDALIVWRWMSGGGVTTLVSGHSLASKQLVFSSPPQPPTISHYPWRPPTLPNSYCSDIAINSSPNIAINWSLDIASNSSPKVRNQLGVSQYNDYNQSSELVFQTRRIFNLSTGS